MRSPRIRGKQKLSMYVYLGRHPAPCYSKNRCFMCLLNTLPIGLCPALQRKAQTVTFYTYRVTLSLVLLLAEYYLPDPAMIVLLAAATIVGLILSQRHESRLISRALCDAKRAFTTAVSRSRER